MSNTTRQPTCVGKQIRKIAEDHHARIDVFKGQVLFLDYISGRSKLWKAIENCINENAVDLHVKLCFQMRKIGGKFTRCVPCWDSFAKTVAENLDKTNSKIGNGSVDRHQRVEYNSLSRVFKVCIDLMTTPPIPTHHEGCKLTSPIPKNSYVATLGLEFEGVNLAVHLYSRHAIPLAS